jgi:hypothetical protein
MTVSTIVNREQYATDGIVAAFAIHFPFYDESDVQAVFLDAAGDATALVLGTDFGIAGGGGAGGTLTAAVPPAAGGTLTIYRDLPFVQEDDYVEDDPLPADTLEGGFDRAVMRDQQLQDGLDRALTFPVTIAPSVSAVLPVPEADSFLGWNTAGNALTNKTVAAGTTVYASVANTNLGLATAESVTPAGLAGSKFNPIGRHMLPILAVSLQPATTNGAAFGTIETTTNKVLYRTLDFDPTTQEFAGFVLPWPKSADEGTISFRALWTAAAGSGGVAWALQAIGRSDDDAIDTAYGTEQMVIDTLLAAGDLHRSAESAAITISTLAEGDLVFLRVKRVPADAADTLAADARLIGLELYMTTNAGTDA